MSNVEDKTSPSDGFKGKNLKTRGGYTCCVPGIYNNNKKNKYLHFYRSPQGQSKEKQQIRKKWILLASRKSFKPGPHHRVCSAHFPGGAKTYDNKIPITVPKNVHSTVSKLRPTQLARNREIFHPNTDLSQAGCKSIDLETTELHFNESSNVDYTSKVNEHEDCKEKKEELSLRILE